MNAGAFSDEGVVKASQDLIRIIADKDRDDRIFSLYKVGSMPTVLFLDYEGKQVGGLVSRAPEAVRKQLSDIAAKHTRAPAWKKDADAALKDGKDGPRPVALVFFEDKPKSAQFLKMFSHPVFEKEFLEKIAFAKVEFKKDSEECKKWKVAEAPALVIIDNTGDEPKILKTLRSGTPKSIKQDLEDAVKKLEKK